MSIASTVFQLVGLAVETVGVSVSQRNHLVTLDTEHHHHEKELKEIHKQNKEALILAKKTHLISAYTNLEQYCQELNENLISSYKESERDMADQRNQQYQNILIAGTVMITALISVLIQGTLPTASSNRLILSYSFCNSMSLVFLSLSIGLCVEINRRVNLYLYERSKADRVNLLLAINEKLSKKNDSNPFDDNKKDIDIEYGYEYEENELKWNQHEKRVHDLLQRRGEIDEAMENVILKDPSGYVTNVDRYATSVIIFENYWEIRCRILACMAMLFFYAGSVFMSTAILEFLYATYQLKYQHPDGANLVIFLGIICLVSFLLFWFYVRAMDANELYKWDKLRDKAKDKPPEESKISPDGCYVWFEPLVAVAYAIYKHPEAFLE
mmetsp:Transcript_27814/g.38314  ORF Transcript_27814/g.38314 Transcript_27814/m.38314 type:complete len:384 (+) Transcript_27814:52-1203(+)|eukprot:CAMPEP_0201094156 /NCGR_PEP_ID=MMETSP0812-20130820/2546_1 /ASSEMBLY_ACC=CAM_ASM_000668 /TAXON_ID=98059 /ORGANISM="Dinobryon sp., Strain UTEXLB2267" /LENGTH=383 /DNA_ID=CAMNT_0047346631 /DNA_START=52 /DNA_END=1203 /DNA_ORIENTATION=+